MSQLTHTLLFPIVIEKKHPVTHEIEIEELKPAGFTVTMRRPKAKDMRAFDRHGDAEIAGVIELIIACSNLGTIEVENLDADDFGALGNLLAPKSPGGQQTGTSA
ncbi:MAG: phage tail assembly protein [Erythrobacter sp.]|uniref:phage tail assembly protein n=1 Tax=Erythrobacter sp. TaxID=1042 RepID=UPI0025EBE991|nr:phage tail assembly protein [Erythrobacter sp.]MCL9999235.1 phage tail assembly protein [Erythrobacter sp.]